MKKLLSLFAATGLVATTSATVVACGDKVETLTWADDKKIEDFVKEASLDTNADGKLDLDFKTPEMPKIDGVTIKGSIKGQIIDSLDKEKGGLGTYFKETKELVSNEETSYVLTAEGNKDDKTVTIYVIKIVGKDVKYEDAVPTSGKITYSTLNKIKLDLPQPKAE
ncbi:hypothetical protein SCHIN_v1c10250 [Spiroplasma chinense]|uniref:Lipoprotein n=1 Tax=Spiroplasma chinense TaxID=216932 RepID=A0A5B9Y4X2_9MOLU|nr:lipoprotein [Spiroplasma chinense]QEH62218.1 hypothetical protein SCHIN_v1c10250 [Spiroplasma chinense]